MNKTRSVKKNQPITKQKQKYAHKFGAKLIELAHSRNDKQPSRLAQKRQKQVIIISNLQFPILHIKNMKQNMLSLSQTIYHLQDTVTLGNQKVWQGHP